MSIDEQNRIYRFLIDYIESRGHFLEEGADVEDEDCAALRIAPVTDSGDKTKTNILFRCASTLEPNAPPVTAWIEECMQAARKEFPDLLGNADLLNVISIRHPYPGLGK